MAARSFVLVLAGGGARGYAHAGVLRGLQHIGLEPAGLVGVSMGAIVAATYSLREDCYQALVAAGIREVRARRADLEAALCSPSPAEHA